MKAGPKRLPLPVRRQMNLTETAYERLRKLNDAYGLGNNYLLVVLLENLDEIVDLQKMDDVFRMYGPPVVVKLGGLMG